MQEAFKKLKAIRLSQALVYGGGLDEEDVISPEQEIALWLEVVEGKNSKGHIFGVGCVA